MVCGAAGYFLLAGVPLFEPAKPVVLSVVHVLTPVLIFLMLFFTFCKVRPADLRPARWHVWLLGLQSVVSVGVALWLISARPSFEVEVAGEAVLACVVCPTAMAAAVITGKLGGNAGSLTAYTLESNLLSALLITALCPMVHASPHLDLWQAFFTLLYKVLMLLILPFLAAWTVRVFLPRLHAACVGVKDLSFYLWGFSLTMVMAQAVRILMINRAHWVTAALLMVVAAVVCSLQFLLGKVIGGRYCERISGGQAFGQKNTVFGIWMALNYLAPISAVAVGGYVVAQNVINSWQLWRKRLRDEV